MTRRYLGYLGLALALIVPAAVKAQVFDQKTLVLATNWDMDGEAADDNQIVLTTDLTDSKTFTITASPDVCRLVDITLSATTTDITAGVLTIVGTDCYGDSLTATHTFTSGGTGQQDLVVSSVSTSLSDNLASGAYFATVTSVTTGVLTGEDAGDAIIIGYTGGSFYQYPMFGKLVYTRTDAPYRYVDMGKWRKGGTNSVITHSGSVLTATGGIGFLNLAVLDLLRINDEAGNSRIVQITTYTNGTTVTVTPSITLPASGAGERIGFDYQKFYLSADPQDGWFNVQGWDTAFVIFDVDAVVSTAGIDSRVQCVPGFIDEDSAVEVDANTILTGATGTAVTSIDFRTDSGYTRCRVGVTFTVGDDSDSANEDVNLYLGLRR